MILYTGNRIQLSVYRLSYAGLKYLFSFTCNKNFIFYFITSQLNNTLTIPNFRFHSTAKSPVTVTVFLKGQKVRMSECFVYGIQTSYFLFVIIYSLTGNFASYILKMKFLSCNQSPVPLHEDKQYDQWQDKCQVKPDGFMCREFHSGSGIGFFYEIIPAPAVSCHTEQKIYQ